MPSHHVARFLLHYSAQPFALIICTFCTKCNSIYKSIFYFCLLHNLYALFLYILTTVTPARFKVGQMIGATGLLLGVALAMYRRVDADKKDNGIQAVYGPKADVLKSDINDIL